MKLYVLMDCDVISLMTASKQELMNEMCDVRGFDMLEVESMIEKCSDDQRVSGELGPALFGLDGKLYVVKDPNLVEDVDHSCQHCGLPGGH